MIARGGTLLPQTAPVLYDTLFMRGGWDLTTPTLELYPGALRDVQNFEVSVNVAGGYARIGGYERFDGRPSPSAASFFLIQLASFLNVPTVGQTLTGQTSSATGVILAITSSYLILTKITGSFQDTEVVKVGGTTIGTATPTTTVLTALLTAQYTQLAADLYRADIGAVPGSGPVRGVVATKFTGSDITYAFRDNAGGTAVDIYKSTTGGWVNVPLYKEVAFTAGGTGIPAEGNTLTEGGVTSTIKRVVLESGSWAAGTAAGRFIISALAGGNYSAGAGTAGSVGVTISGIQTNIALAVGGKFEFDVSNFTGDAATMRVYGCDGVNRGFEFDGDVLVPIHTGFTTDTPTHVKVHHLHLCFAFGSSVGISAVGFPYKWTATDGAVELACGDVVTNLMRMPAGTSSATLGVTTNTDLKILYGVDSQSWLLMSLNAGTGGTAYSAQPMTDGYVMTGFGVVGLHTTLAFGNFKQAALTNTVLDYIVTQRSKVVYSVLNRTKNQYRVYFSDGASLCLTISNGKLAGISKSLFPTVMNCAWSSITVALNEKVFCGASTGGYVYQMDIGSSFDGAAIEAFLVLNWNTMKQPRRHKRFRKASLEMQSNFYANVSVGYALGYGTPRLVQPGAVNYDSGFVSAPAWDSFVWDAFTWDGVTLSPTEVRLVGTAENIQLTLRSGTNYIQPFLINSIITNYSLRRGVR